MFVLSDLLRHCFDERHQAPAHPRIHPLLEELEPRALLAAATGGVVGPLATTALSPVLGSAAQAISPTGAVISGVPNTAGAAATSAFTTLPTIAPTTAALAAQVFTGLPGQGFGAESTDGAPFAGLRPAVEQGQGAEFMAQISFSQLAIPGSSAAPTAQLPAVPFPYITGPVMPAPGPVNTAPTFAIDVARVNNGVGEVQAPPAATPSPGRTIPMLPMLPLLPIPFLLESPTVIPMPLPETAPATEPLDVGVPQAVSGSEAAWSLGGGASLTEPVDAAAPLATATPRLVEEPAAPSPEPAVAGLVVLFGGALWGVPGSSFPGTETERRRQAYGLPV